MQKVKKLGAGFSCTFFVVQFFFHLEDLELRAHNTRSEKDIHFVFHFGNINPCL